MHVLVIGVMLKQVERRIWLPGKQKQVQTNEQIRLETEKDGWTPGNWEIEDKHDHHNACIPSSIPL